MQGILSSSGFPSELMVKPNWCCWRYQERAGKRTKRPYHPDGRSARSNAPSTWSTLEACSTASGFDGIGFMFDGTCFGVDLDHVINPESGEVEQFALDIVGRLGSYVEYSPSGTGLHILCLGKLPTVKGRRSGAVEVYGTGRFFTVTGRPFGDVRPIRDASAEIEQIISDYIDGRRTQPQSVDAQSPAGGSSTGAQLTAEQVIEHIRRCRSREVVERFTALYERGDTSAYRGDDSAADLALCNMLAFWTGKDPKLMDEIFRRSALYRDKWDQFRGADTYGNITINRAIVDTLHAYGDGRAEPDWGDGGSPFYRFEQAYAQTYGYRVKHGVTFAVKEGKDGTQELIPLAQFAALPVEAVTRDNGAEVRQDFVLTGVNHRGKLLPPVNVPASKLAAMNWALESWGLDANIMPGQAVKDRLRHAIVEAGGLCVQQRTVYEHTGWRKIDGRWVFLHGGGAIGADGVSVELEGALSAYSLPDQAGDMRPSLELLEVLPREVAVPLLGHVFLAPLCEFLRQAGCPPLYTLFLAGSSGAKKSTAAALALSHFGAGFNVSRLPANFHDTAGTLRKKAFLLKDVPLLIDDLHPTADPRERRVMDGAAQNMARAWGDLAERGRMRSDLTLQTAQPPRGLGLMTGEDLPDVGESGVARFYLVDVKRNTVKITPQLSDLQKKASTGALAASMRSFIEWLIPQADALPEVLRSSWEHLRAQARDALPGAHDRQPPAVAWLALGYQTMLACVRDQGILTQEQADQMAADAFETLVDGAREQRRDMQGESPVDLFLSTLEELEASGAIEICERDSVTGGWSTARPDAQRVGYRDDEFLYLLPQAAHGAVNRALQQSGRSFPISGARLWKTMLEQGRAVAHAGGATSRSKAFGQLKTRVVWVPLTPEQQQLQREKAAAL